MSYTALYRKWRPVTFEDVKGQDPIVRTLKNQILTGRIGHAYLFCGTRGTGKTSIAKIFARAVNCEHPVDGSPCNSCPACRAILSGSSMNVAEIDAASNNGVDSVREIREQVQYPPAEGRYRVYIIDEVHMLSTGAFNALLKTLEEPPEYVIFILATTEVHKIPVTVLSRCQRYDFRRIDVGTLTARLKELTEAEHVPAEERALAYIARAADGSMRDALSLLDQCVAFHYGELLTYDNVLDVLGAVDSEVFSRLLRAVAGGQTADCLKLLEEVVIQGRELGQFVTDFIWYLRNLLVLKSTDDAEGILDMSEDSLRRLQEETALVSDDTLMRYIRIFSDLANQLRYAGQKRVLVEIALIRLTHPQMERGLDAVLQRLDELETRVEQTPQITPELLSQMAERAAGSSSGTPAAPAAASAQQSAPAVSPPETVLLPKAQYEDLMQITRDWPQIIRELGASFRPIFRESQLEPAGEGGLGIVFRDVGNFNNANRPTILGQLEAYVKEHYHKDIYFKVRLRGPGEVTNRIYLSEGEAEKVIHTEIEIED